MTQSVWRATAATPATYAQLTGDVETDVAIVGGGITGVTCAALLAAAGRRVVLLEARSIALGSTGNSTGNLYEVVDRGLAAVADKWDADIAAQVIASRRQAVELVERFAEALGAPTRFRRCALYQYSKDDWSAIAAEYEVLKACGVAVRFDDDAPLPGGPGRALVIDGQAQFHPLNYVQALAARAAGLGARIHEHTAVVEVDTRHHVLRTDAGSVKANEIVLATHTPKGIFGLHAQMLTYREYGAACEATAAALPAGIFWQLGETPRSFRTLADDGRHYLMVVGASHKTGRHDSGQALADIDAALGEIAPASADRWTWSAQNYQSPDLLPHIGRSPMSEAFIATGFGTDGLTYGTLAAQIVADEILGHANAWAHLYRAARFSPIKSAKQLLEEQAIALQGLVKDRVGVPDYAGHASVASGSGAVVDVDGDKVAIHRDEADRLHAVSAVCTHMGCIVHWNDVEKSWDCPCHGSRFDIRGDVIEGPALSALKTVDIETQGD